MASDIKVDALVDSILQRLDTLEAIRERANASSNDRDEGAAGFTAEQVNVFKQAFDSFDSDSSGEISPAELGQICKMLGTPVEPEQLQTIMDEVDENRDGVVDFQEFLGMMKKIIDKSGEQNEGVGMMKLKKLSHYGRDALLRWIKDDPPELDGDVTGPSVCALCRFSRRILMNRTFEWFVYAVIGIVAVLSGLQTYDAFSDNLLIETLEHASLAVFVVEIVIKFCAETAGKNHHFFWDGWNTFDFCIVVFLAAMVPFSDGQYDAVRLVRLLRAFRLLKATRVLPKLGLVVETLITSSSSVLYIAMFLVLIAYIFAIIGVSTFRLNDPFHFGNLGIAMLTLFRMSTLDDWTDIMYFNMYGCNWGNAGAYADATGNTPCDQPEAFGFTATFFSVAFVTLSSFLMLNLFIGVITSSMAEAKDEMYRRKKENARLALAQRMRGKTKRKEEKAAQQALQEEEERKE